MDLSKSMRISAAGLEAQSARMRTIAENLANADSLPQEPGADPYRRKMLTFKNELDRATGAKLVHPDRLVQDKSEFQKRFADGLLLQAHAARFPRRQLGVVRVAFFFGRGQVTRRFVT